MNSKSIPENERFYRDAFMKAAHPKSFIDAIRLMRYYQSHTPLSETERHEFHRMVSGLHEEPSTSEKNPDILDEDNVYIDSSDHWGPFTYEEIHGVINDLIEEISYLDNTNDYNNQTNDEISATQVFLDNSVADIRCITKDSKKGYYRRRTKGRKFQYCHITIVNAMVIQYDNRFNFLDGKTLYTVIFYRVAICLHVKIVIIEVDIIVTDCKFHVHPFVEYIQKGIYTLFGNKLEDALMVEPQEQNMRCANMKKESNVDEVERVKEDKSFVTQKHGEIVIDGKDVTSSRDRLSLTFKKMKHGWLSWLLLFFILYGANAQQIEEKKLLTSKTCSQKIFYTLNQICHTDEIAHNMTIDYCNFKSLCGTDEHPKCINTEKMVVYVCLRKNLTCPKGRTVVAWQDQQFPDVVYVQETDCPNGTFQPNKSDCIPACSLKHRNLSDMSERYIVSSEGDHINPTKVYCNFKKGYYNPDGKFTLDYDKEEISNPYFCTNVVDGNPCMEGKVPLPDGLCVHECEQGFERNPPDFQCRQIAITSNTFATKTGNIPTQILPVSTTVSSTTTRSPITTSNVATNKVTQPREHKEVKYETFPWWGYLLCAVGVLACVFGIARYWYYKRSKRERKEKNVQNNGNTYYNINGPETVNIYNTEHSTAAHSNEQTIGMVSDAADQEC